jgi:nucleotide-binding universal stress UspA family protein
MKVIVSIDQTEFADQIVNEVASTDWPADTQIKVLTVVAPLVGVEKDVESAKSLEKREKLANDLALNARKLICESCPQCVVHVEVRCGEPQKEIIFSAAEWMADRIVIGAHGNSPNRFFGTVAKSVAKSSVCSVQLVRLKKSKIAKEQSDVCTPAAV